MDSKKIRRLVVTEEDGTVAGIVTTTDLILHLAKELEYKP